MVIKALSKKSAMYSFNLLTATKDFEKSFITSFEDGWIVIKINSERDSLATVVHRNVTRLLCSIDPSNITIDDIRTFNELLAS